MTLLRIDPHAHLYDTYSLETWCQAAVDNLGVASDVLGAVIVVDREGQDSLKRLRSELGEERWRDASPETNRPEKVLTGQCTVGDLRLTIVRGVQYISSERIEVLGLGVSRSVADGEPCCDLIARINSEGGIACLPWSPGKWLGSRGRVINDILSSASPAECIIGDIALRTRLGPPSLLLSSARRRGFSVVAGTDPLPRSEDAALVGSYGVEIRLENTPLEGLGAPSITQLIKNNSGELRCFGRPNSVLVAAARFLSTFSRL
jgi:hypothetical protein